MNNFPHYQPTKPGYYWLRRTTAPLAIGGRDTWIAFWDGVYWQCIGTDLCWTNVDFELEGFQIISSVNELTSLR